MDRDHMLESAAQRNTNSEHSTRPSNSGPSQPSTGNPQNLQMSSSYSAPLPPAYSQSADSSFTDASPFKPLPTRHHVQKTMLPPLSAVTQAGPSYRADCLSAQVPATVSTRSILNPVAAFSPRPQVSIDSPSAMDIDASIASAASPDRYLDGRAPSVNLDDPDVRLAAEALGDLRADFVSSPPSGNMILPVSPPIAALRKGRSQSPQSIQPEPLFSLLTTSHPFLATTIGNASSAYGGAKNFSPRFKSSAEYVENYLTPLANTVGSVGRVTGVEGSVRWFLGAGRRNASSSSDIEAVGNSKKRRKVDKDAEMISNKRLDSEPLKQLTSLSQRELLEQDLYPPTPRGDRRLSMASTADSLPAYDEQRSPAYTETADGQRGPTSSANPNAAWQSRLAMSTSGLGVAMSDESLRSLKYCLRWLRWANDHIGGVIGSLKTTLDQYDGHSDSQMAQLEATERQDQPAENGEMAMITQEQSRTELAARINVLKGDVLKTLQDAITTVSKYAGGALPENARILVRRHLTSLPQRFRVATMAENNDQNGEQDSDSALREGAQKVLVLAKEGLDMVAQVSGVLDGTIVSAEEWCERMGKKKPSTDESSKSQDEQCLLPQPEETGDVKMG